LSCLKESKGEMSVTTETQAFKQIIIDKIRELLNWSDELILDTDLRNNGLDSIKTIELIVIFETTFDIQIEDQDLLVENFSTVNRILSLLTEKYGVHQ
jgi:acyl carrier protein